MELFVPLGTGLGLAVNVRLAGARPVTVRVVVPDDGANLLSPEYVPVTVSVPTGAFEAVHDPEPLTRPPVVHSVIDPAVKVTAPVGVPDEEVTVA